MKKKTLETRKLKSTEKQNKNKSNTNIKKKHTNQK